MGDGDCGRDADGREQYKDEMGTTEQKIQRTKWERGRRTLRPVRDDGGGDIHEGRCGYD